MGADDLLFWLANLVAAPVWGLMLVAPGSRITERVVRSLIGPIVLAVLYLVLVVTNMGATDGGFFPLDAVMRLFTNRRVVLTGWVHYLAFDLVVGSLLFSDARRLRLPHGRMIAPLLLSLLWGPIGLLAYLGVRSFSRVPIAALLALGEPLPAPPSPEEDDADDPGPRTSA